MKHYRKMIAAVVGVGILLLNRYTGIDLAPETATLVEGFVGLGTVLGVWGLRND